MILSVLAKAAMSLGMKMLSAALLEDLMMWAIEKLAAHTETKVDDELVAKIKEHMGK